MSLSKNQIKFISSLHSKKQRETSGLFIIEGEKIALEALQQSSFEIYGIYCTQEWMQSNRSILDNKDIPINICIKSDLEKISALKNATEVLLILKIAPNKNLSPVGKTNIILEHIQDPGNLGTIIRIADWFGIENIFCSNDTVEFYNPKVLQASMGSFLRANIEYTNLEILLNKYGQIPCYAALLNGENAYLQKFPTEMFLMIGNEGKGLSENILKYPHIPVSIPRFGQAESLNAAVATAIFCALIKK